MNTETEHRFPFGRYRGQPLTDADTPYLRWLLGSGVKLGSGLRQAVVDELQRRGLTPPAPAAPKPLSPCGRCGNTEAPWLTWHQIADGRKQIRRTCSRCGSWQGTPSELYEALTKLAGDAVSKSREWPKKPNVLSGCLTRLAPNLRRAGIAFDRVRAPGGKRTRAVCLHRCDPADQNRSATDRPDRPDRPDADKKQSPDSTCDADARDIWSVPESSQDRPDRPASVPGSSRPNYQSGEEVAASRDAGDARDDPFPSCSDGGAEEDDRGDAWDGDPADSDEF